MKARSVLKYCLMSLAACSCAPICSLSRSLTVLNLFLAYLQCSSSWLFFHPPTSRLLSILHYVSWFLFFCPELFFLQFLDHSELIPCLPTVFFLLVILLPSTSRLLSILPHVSCFLFCPSLFFLQFLGRSELIPCLATVFYLLVILLPSYLTSLFSKVLRKEV